MTDHFVILTREEVLAWADRQFGPDGYRVTRPLRGYEDVIVFPTGIGGMEIHAYTTVDDERQSRAKGKDAMRFVLFDRVSCKPVASAKKVLRVSGALERCAERIAELRQEALEVERAGRLCLRCGGVMLERKNNATGQVFYGCGLFPLCDARRPFNPIGQQVLNYWTDHYPLTDGNPEASARPGANPYAPNTRTLHAEPEPDEWGDEDYEDEDGWYEEDADAPMRLFPIADERELVPTATVPELRYGFSHFNRIQSGVWNAGVAFMDCNFILGTATSSGKTIAAELAIAAALNVVRPR